ncbi:hypothetical protein ABMA28_003289 [Loxostege sticticalis]|uniref:Uncharacterized protein n=1 Tax=Loxostege sticticalis TaxID=481309 RepID=A0ABD0SVL6_LOXSC
MRRTGGGPPPTPPSDFSDTTDWLRAIIPSSIDGNLAIYDDDVIIPKPTPEKIIEIPDNEKKSNEASVTNEKWDFDPSTPYSSLKKPMSSPLKSRANKRRPAENLNSNVVRQLLREKKLSVMDNLQDLELQRLKDSIRHAQELHEQTLRHNEERHKLEIEKLHLDIRILKKSDEFI